MKKRMLALLLAGAMCVSLAACGSDTGSKNSQAPSTNTAEPQGGSDSSSDVKWPNGQDVYIDIPAKAGGGTDLMARYLTTPWASIVDGNMVVNNYDTAEVGAQHAAKAAPDGLTLTMASTVNMDNYLTGSSEVNPYQDLTVIGKFSAGGPQALVARADAPFDDLQGLAEYAKAHPGELVTGVALGGTSQLCWINLTKAMGGIELNYVQAGAEADKLTNVAAGSLDLGNCSLNNAKAYEADGKIKVLGILGISDKLGKDDYMADLPDNYKTTWEQGYEGAAWPAGGYICGPAGMDEALARTINESMQQVKDDPTFVEGMASMSQVIEFLNLEESRASFEAEWQLQVELTTNLGINIRN